MQNPKVGPWNTSDQVYPHHSRKTIYPTRRQDTCRTPSKVRIPETNVTITFCSRQLG